MDESDEPELLRLRFHDADLEKAYSEDHARRSVVPVRVLAVLLAVMSILLSIMVVKWASADAVGVGVFGPDVEPFFWPRLFLSLGAMVSLVAFVGRPSVLPRQQTFIAGLLAILIGCDVPSTVQLPLAYGLNATLFQVMGAYVLLRLRLRWAAVLGIGTTSAYLAGAAAVLPDHEPLPPAFVLNVTALIVTNVVLSVASHQIERLDRLAFLGRYRGQQRELALQTAIDELSGAQAQLIEAEREASIGRLAAGLLHEFNTPLGVVRSTADTLRRSVLKWLEQGAPGNERASEVPPRSLRALEKLLSSQQEAVHRLSHVVEGVERFVDLDRDGVRTVDLRRSLRDAYQLLGPRLEGVRIVDELPEPIAVRCDPGRMNYAFFAVLENAANALNGAGEVRLRALRSGPAWRLEVSDTGPGIPNLARKRLFEPGFSRDGGRVKLRLGLPSASLAARACGGRLEVSCPPGGGTTVCFELPADDGPSSRANGVSRAAEPRAES